MNNKTVVSFPFIYILTLIFVVAKIFAGWQVSWWIVFAPVLIPWALIGAALFIGVLASLVAAIFD